MADKNLPGKSDKIVVSDYSLSRIQDNLSRALDAILTFLTAVFSYNTKTKVLNVAATTVAVKNLTADTATIGALVASTTSPSITTTTLTVTGASNLNTITATGTSSLAGVAASGAITGASYSGGPISGTTGNFSSTLGVTGASTLAAVSATTLSTSGLATLNSANVTNNSTVGSSTVTGNETVGGSLKVTLGIGAGNTTPLGAFDSYNAPSTAAWSYFGANVTGNPSSSRTVGPMLGWNRSNFAGEANIVWGTTAGSTPDLEFGTWDGTTYTKRATLSRTGDFNATGALTGAGYSGGPISGTTLSTSGLATLNSAKVTNNSTVGSSTVLGNEIVGGTLGVSGATTLKSTSSVDVPSAASSSGLLVGPHEITNGGGQLQVFQNRSDGNTTFGGRLGLSMWQSDGTTTLQQGFVLGRVLFGGQVGTNTTFNQSNMYYGAQIGAYADETWSTSGHNGTYLSFYTQPNGFGGGTFDTLNNNGAWGTERLRIQSNGLVDIYSGLAVTGGAITSTNGFKSQVGPWTFGTSSSPTAAQAGLVASFDTFAGTVTHKLLTWAAPYPGSVLAVDIGCNSSAGNVTATVYKNGIATALHATIAATALTGVALQAKGLTTFVSNDVLAVYFQFTSSGVSNVLTSFITVEMDA